MSNARTLASLPASTLTAQNSRNGFVPAGVTLPFAGTVEPTGWLLCYGQAVSRTTYGTGDGSTTFNLPDLRGRVPGGKDNMGGTAASRLTSGGSGVNGATLGAAGGAETHTLTTAQMPAHTHSGGATVLFGGTAGATSYVGNGSATTGSAGSGNAHNNTQPTIVLNYIIKT